MQWPTVLRGVTSRRQLGRAAAEAESALGVGVLMPQSTDVQPGNQGPVSLAECWAVAFDGRADSDSGGSA